MIGFLHRKLGLRKGRRGKTSSPVLIRSERRILFSVFKEAGSQYEWLKRWPVTETYPCERSKRMGYLRFNFRSQELGRYVDVSVVYPTDRYSYMKEKAEKGQGIYEPGMRFQTVYLIHGGGDDDTLTYRYTNAERYAQKNHVMLVTPNLTNSFGVYTEYGVYYQSFLALELPSVMQSLFAAAMEREDRFIVGYAMGGNVALGTALLHPQSFRACIDISGGIGMTLDTRTLQEELLGEHFRNNFRLYNTSFGDAEGIPGSRFDIRCAAEQALERGERLPELQLACGEKEFIRGRMEKDVEILKKMGIPVRYHLLPDMDHDFEMWDLCIHKALDEWLPLKRLPVEGGRSSGCMR